MEYSEKNWINGHGVSICEGINEIEHTSLGGELIIHGGLSIQNIYTTVTTLSSDSIQIIDKRKIYEKSIDSRYRVLDNVQVGFDFN
ncbi:hypothetical protein HNQ93_003471 [Hymenobacter luteus]|uniref:Uncharacterized protein n=2 Tax=Hymenobacter TaxID=89966 RepID=A0A7W9T2Z1_9BACT|nr:MULTISPECIES: hypothetical protein [Hymenobacter]MBB4602706.1 hypothetical protein [Hymenobacter latericoloratus]MBB6060597.1 hypothetical protein [Hymenobacter luteus]